MNKNRLILGLAGLTFLGIAGCDSATLPKAVAPTPVAAPAAARENPFDRVTRGMSAAEVRALVGEPREIKTDATGSTTDEIWRYQYKLDETVRQVPIGTREIPAINPITGQAITVMEPIMTDEFSAIYQDISLLMIDGRVSDIGRKQRVERKTL